MRPASIPYRPDIDGLRAVALVLVLLFHCGFGAFRGGFIGVDVFFVISGYLITSLILADLRHGTFDFYRFYARRVRRLLPATLATVIVTLLGSAAIMAPEHLVDTAKSGAFAAISVSNFYFALVAHYFDASAQAKPLLHTWSLGVEEQYYLFWPAILFVLFRRGGKWAIPVAVFAGIPVGLALSEYGIGRNPNHAYFLLPYRAFQFLLGAACIWLLRIEIRSKVVAGALYLLGLGTVIATACLYSEATPFPGVYALVPSAATMLIIWLGGRESLRCLLSNRPMVWLGRISYSTYLVHWPIVVFWLYLAIGPPSLTEKFVLLGVCLLGGQALYRLVEHRFRYPAAGQGAGGDRFRMGMAGTLGAVAVVCALPLVTAGLPGRMALVPEAAEYRRQSQFQFLRDYADGVMSVGSEGGARVLFFGDSMMQNYIPAILQIDGFRNARVDIVSRGGCVLAKDALLVNHGAPDRECLELRERLYSLKGPYDIVAWGQSWMGYDRNLYWQARGTEPVPAFPDGYSAGGWTAGIERTLEHFRTISKQVVVIGPAATVSNVNSVLARIGPLTDVAAIPRTFGAMRQSSTAETEVMSRSIRAIVSREGGDLYIDPRQIVCAGGQCRLWSGKYSYYLDELHYTAAATRMLREGLEQQGLRLPGPGSDPVATLSR